MVFRVGRRGEIVQLLGVEDVHPSLSVEAARKRLGLGPKDRLEDYLPHWQAVELRLEELAMEADDPQVSLNYERELEDLRWVLAAASRPVKKKTGAWAWVALVLVGLFLGGGYLASQNWEMVERYLPQGKADQQEKKERFAEAMEKRRWGEAEVFLKELEGAGADSAFLREGRVALEKGRGSESEQQVAFLVSNVQSAFEAGQLAEAEKFCEELERVRPDHAKLAGLRRMIEEGKLEMGSLVLVTQIEEAMGRGDWELAEDDLGKLAVLNPKSGRLVGLREQLELGKRAMAARREEATKLVARARELDQGVFSAEALALMEEAVRLDPSAENREFFRKLASYGRVLKVPGDFATVGEALAKAKENDRIFVSKGTYRESLVLPSGVALLGEGREATVIEWPVAEGPVIRVDSGAGRSRIAGMSLRHLGVLNDAERFPVIGVDGGEVDLEDLSVKGAGGHGIAVLDGGRAKIVNVQVTESGWDGISAKGEGTFVELERVISKGNLHHGVDFWEGASGMVRECEFSGNGRAGVLVSSPGGPVGISKTKSAGNREVGFYFLKTRGLLLERSVAMENQLGGVVIEGESGELSLVENEMIKNGEVGLVVERGLVLTEERGNRVEENVGRQIWKEADFPAREEVEGLTVPPPPPPGE